jgi:hypothetical protein
VQAWAIGHALSIGPPIYQCITLKVLTPALPERAHAARCWHATTALASGNGFVVTWERST